MNCNGNCSECFERKEGNCLPVQEKINLIEFLKDEDLLPDYYDFE
jgi:hypothetical protein